MKSYKEIRERLQTRILQELDYTHQTGDELVLEEIDDAILEAGREETLALADMKRLRSDLFHSIRRLDVLQDLLEAPGITEVMINGTDPIFIEKEGRIRQTDLSFPSREKLENVIQQIVSACNRVVNESSPVVDARLPDGSRVNVVLPPVALNGPVVTIRRFPEKPIRMPDLIRLGSVAPGTAAFLSRLVQARYNIFISGGTGSGKTTFLNALSDYIPVEERLITIEDNAELQIQHLPNLVQLEVRNQNVEGCQPVTIRDLIRASLRMRPDRIIVGEVRGGETLDMLQAMNTGHEGSMSTGHANSAKDMLSRLETMILCASESLPLAAIRGQIASGLDLIIHLGRLRDGSRRLLRIEEVDGMEEGGIRLRTLLRFCEDGEKDGRILGHWQRENPLRNTDKLARAGLSLPEEEEYSEGTGDDIAVSNPAGIAVGGTETRSDRCREEPS